MFIRARVKKDGMKYVCKVCRQHNSLVCVVPYGVRTKLGIDAGDLVSFVIYDKSKACEFAIELKGVTGRERSKRDTDRIHQGRSL